jgi:hypothetical protein
LSYAIGIDTLLRIIDPVYTGGSSELMAHALASMVMDGSDFFVLPRTFGAANIPAKFGLQLGHDELLTYAMVCDRVPESVRAAFKEVTGGPAATTTRAFDFARHCRQCAFDCRSAAAHTWICPPPPCGGSGSSIRYPAHSLLHLAHRCKRVNGCELHFSRPPRGGHNVCATRANPIPTPSPAFLTSMMQLLSDSIKYFAQCA